MRAAVLGKPVGHSLSPVLHNAGYVAAGLLLIAVVGYALYTIFGTSPSSVLPPAIDPLPNLPSVQPPAVDPLPNLPVQPPAVDTVPSLPSIDAPPSTTYSVSWLVAATGDAFSASADIETRSDGRATVRRASAMSRGVTRYPRRASTAAAGCSRVSVA